MLRTQNTNVRSLRGTHRTPAEWLAMVEDPAFAALVSRKRRYLVISWLVVVCSYLALACGASLAPDLFAEPVVGELNAGLLLVIGEVLLCILIAWLYVHRAGQQFDRDADALARRFRARVAGGDARTAVPE